MCDNSEMEYSINMRAEPLNHQIYRIYFIHIDRKLLPYLQFKFEYKYLDDPLWQDIRPFDCRACRISPQNGDIFTYIRIPYKLYNYSLNIRLRLNILANAFGFPANVWMKYSDILTIKVLSSLYESSAFKIGSMVKFRPSNKNQFHYGKIIDISSDLSSNKYNELLNVCSIEDDEKPNKIWTHIPFAILLQLLTDNFIDFCVIDRNYADLQILFRSNKLNNDLNNTCFNIYCALFESGMYFATEYFDQFEDSYEGEIAINGQGRCFAFNVMCMLFGDAIQNDYNLKLNCLKNCGANLYTKSIHTVNKYRIDNHLDQQYMVGCDICRSAINEYDFMFHCDNINELKHDFCVLCVYEMTQKYKYFKDLLQPLLLNNKLLNNTCIDVLISFMVGRVIKFQYDECKRDF